MAVSIAREQEVFSMRNFSSRESGGFSLLEVLFALGIIVTVGISLIGLIPSGFDTVRRAGDLSVIARIVQTISSDALSSDWEEYAEQFSSNGTMVRYFDDQGNALERSGLRNHIYTASIELAGASTSASAASATSLPGDEKMRIDRSRDLRRILIRVTNVPGELGVEALKGGENSGRISNHFVIVPNLNPIEKVEAP